MRKLFILFLLIAFIPIVSAAPFSVTDYTTSGFAADAVTASIGAKILVYDNVTLTAVGRVPTCAATNLTIRTEAGAIITSTSTVSADTFTVSVPLIGGKYYRIEMGDNGNLYNGMANNTFIFPVIRSTVEFISISNAGADETGNTITCLNNLTVQFVNPPGVSKIRPINATTIGTPVRLNTTIISNTGNLANATLYLWNKTGFLLNTTFTTTSGTFANLSFTPSGLNKTSLTDYYFWNVFVCMSGGGGCGFATYNSTFYLASQVNNNTANASSYQTERQSFISNITSPVGATVSSATLFYGNTSYSGTVATNGNDTILSTSFDVPLLSGVQQWFWRVLLSTGESQDFQNSSQFVSIINLTLCTAAPQNIAYVNFTFKNETVAQQSLSATLSSEWTYYLGSGTVTRSLSYNSVSEVSSYSFCFSPQNKTLKATPEITFANSYSQQRSYSPGLLTLTNSTTNTTLWLLPNSEGSFVTFQVINPFLQPLSGVTVNLSRSGFGLLEERTTSGTGTATFFLDPDIEYTVCASRSDLGSTCVTDFFTNSQYTITLGSNQTTIPSDYTKGVTYLMQPLSLSLVNNTAYNFNLTLNSTYWDLDSWGFRLLNASGAVVASNTSTVGTGGFLSVTYNTGNQSLIIMNAFWEINDSFQNRTRSWLVINTQETQWSIARFFTDLSLYLNDPTDADGLFGLKNEPGNNFSLAILVFFIIFLATGLLAYRYGITSPASIMCFMLALVVFFDVTVDIIGPGTTPMATIIVALLFVATLIREVTR